MRHAALFTASLITFGSLSAQADASPLELIKQKARMCAEHARTHTPASTSACHIDELRRDVCTVTVGISAHVKNHEQSRAAEEHLDRVFNYAFECMQHAWPSKEMFLLKEHDENTPTSQRRARWLQFDEAAVTIDNWYVTKGDAYELKITVQPGKH